MWAGYSVSGSISPYMAVFCLIMFCDNPLHFKMQAGRGYYRSGIPSRNCHKFRSPSGAGAQTRGSGLFMRLLI